jgi:hypothetical protein
MSDPRYVLIDIMIPACWGCDQPADHRIRDTTNNRTVGRAYCYVCAQRALYRLNGDES